MTEVAVIGVGATEWGKFPGKTFPDLARVACQRALEDAGVRWTDIQLVAGGEAPYVGIPGMQAGSTISERMGYHGVPVVNIWNACATGGYTLATARAFIASGYCDIALCVGSFTAPGGFFGAGSSDPTDVDAQRFRVLGMTNPSMFAQEATRRMHEYGTTHFDLAQVKVKNSKAGVHNPLARYRREFSLEEVMNSPMVTYPLRLFEIAATSDGAAAVVVASLKKAQELGRKPVKIAAFSGPSPQYPHTDPGWYANYFSSDSTISTPAGEGHARLVARKAYEEAGLGPEDLDFAEVYDLSTNLELDWVENLGLCPPGEAERLLRDGETAIGGRIPINPSGGIAAFGESIPAQALLQVCELTWQLRGEAGARQVKGAKVGLSINRGLGGNTSAVVLKT
ncbi:MAG: lipid-transfer protein [Chloroflexi bacterium]|nr:lipid-transfer protein [Chloroflexota bacterium]